jgi:hypothetical protein
MTNPIAAMSPGIVEEAKAAKVALSARIATALAQFTADTGLAALAKYGTPTPQPVAVSERLPGPEDCTAQGWCWVFYRGFATWTLEPPLGQDGKHTGYTHWLPANALPTPEATND